jgi:hypothetical protein
MNLAIIIGNVLLSVWKNIIIIKRDGAIRGAMAGFMCIDLEKSIFDFTCYVDFRLLEGRTLEGWEAGEQGG